MRNTVDTACHKGVLHMVICRRRLTTIVCKVAPAVREHPGAVASTQVGGTDAVNSSDARLVCAVLCRPHGEERPAARLPPVYRRARDGVRAQESLLAAGMARLFGSDLSGPSGSAAPLPTRLVVSSGIPEPRHLCAVQLNYIPNAEAQRGMADRKSREVPAGCGAPCLRSGSQVAPTESSEKCRSLGMETRGATGGPSMCPLAGPRLVWNPPGLLNWTRTSPPTVWLRSGRSAHLSGRANR